MRVNNFSFLGLKNIKFDVFKFDKMQKFALLDTNKTLQGFKNV